MRAVTRNHFFELVICEIGGTVGDIESLPFWSDPQFRKEVGRDDCLNIHVTLVPYMDTTGDLKQTYATQRERVA